MFPVSRNADLHYTAEELLPAQRRLELAEEAWARGTGTPQQRLAEAWTFVAELRLPRTVIPGAVQDEIDRLLGLWDRVRPAGLQRYAFSLDEGACASEAEIVRQMLQCIEDAIAVARERDRTT